MSLGPASVTLTIQLVLTIRYWLNCKWLALRGTLLDVWCAQPGICFDIPIITHTHPASQSYLSSCFTPSNASMYAVGSKQSTRGSFPMPDGSSCIFKCSIQVHTMQVCKRLQQCDFAGFASSTCCAICLKPKTSSCLIIIQANHDANPIAIHMQSVQPSGWC